MTTQPVQMAETSPQPASKPGTACIGCRRRKLKCSREPDGCSNCLKTDLPCVYPAPETGIKRKRGPYKKDKPPRERHLEDLVKYLEPRAVLADEHTSVRPVAFETIPSSQINHAESPLDAAERGSAALRNLRLEARGDRTASNAEELVKDALIALTSTSAADREPVPDNVVTLAQSATKPANELGGLGQHPPIRRIFEFWHLFVSRVDPLTKVIHCPTFAKTLFASLNDLRGLGGPTQALLFSVYYAAVSTCTAREARARFNEARDVLLQRYGRAVEAALADNYGLPELESLQAIVLYITAIRREDNVTNMRALFSLGVRMAQLMGLNNDPGDSYPPLQAELRRRAWWHLCALESRGAEEGGARKTSIMQGVQVELPSNLFDFDLHEDTTNFPLPRFGITDMAFILIRFDVICLIRDLVKIRIQHSSKEDDTGGTDLKTTQRARLEEVTKDFETRYLRHLDTSRPFDWMCLRFAQTMLIKARLIIDHPFGQVPTKEMSAAERLDLLKASVDIIAFSHSLTDSRRRDTEPWLWYVRGWTQWHSLAIVIAELGRSLNRQFANHAWAVLDPILARWDKVYRMKREEPAWDHVNALIERARQTRKKDLLASKPAQRSVEQTVSSPPGPTTSQPAPLQQTPGMTTTVEMINTPQDFYTVPGYPGIMPQPYQPTTWENPFPSTMQATQVPFHTGCAPAMQGFQGDFGDFGAFADWENVDFSAFDAVFGDISWDMSSQNTDWSMEGFNG